MIIRGTTPTDPITTDLDLTDAEVVWVTFKQRNITIIEKGKDDITIEPERIIVSLTQSETLSLKAHLQVKIQIRARFADGTAVASNEMTEEVGDVLKGGVI